MSKAEGGGTSSEGHSKKTGLCAKISGESLNPAHLVPSRCQSCSELFCGSALPSGSSPNSSA